MIGKAFRLLWPERRSVSGAVIRIWYADAAANGVCAPGATSEGEMAQALHDSGLITLAAVRS